MRIYRILTAGLLGLMICACSTSDEDSTKSGSPSVSDTPQDPIAPPVPSDPSDQGAQTDPSLPSDPVTPPDPSLPPDAGVPQEPTQVDPPAASDPCANMSCPQGTCQEGVCVTAAMKAVKEGDICDPETFVEFCNGNMSVYCDHGVVQVAPCSESCVIYEETYFGRVRMQSGCVDGGACTELNALRRECSIVSGMGQVLATACQKTTRGELKWVSVDGYYCKGACDANKEKCALIENECDPYDLNNYKCDRHSLTKCYLDSNLTASVRKDYCDDKCVTVHGVAMCGFACTSENARENRCVYADSTDMYDSGDFICTKTDEGELYSVWTGEYSACLDGCDHSSGVCK
ncbi:MAG: hypothetical protein IKY83_14300 [Proteobacteria bacterium]|nr:hypothetical protein [Pseudomonadota bacterium]